MTPSDLDGVSKSWVYPGGEVGVRALASQERITARVQNSEDLLRLLMYLDAAVPKPVSVHIPYMPYARQDRRATAGDPCAVYLLAKMLAATGVREFSTIDVHSKYSRLAFLEAGLLLSSVSPFLYLKRYLESIDAGYWLVAPDAGATDKVCGYVELLSSRVMCCEKQRDPVTGALSGFKLIYPPKDVDKAVIVDDICDGGGTFHGVAAELQRHFPGAELHLFTTHGIYSKGLGALLQTFKTIGSTNSFLHGLSDPRLITIPI